MGLYLGHRSMQIITARGSKNSLHKYGEIRSKTILSRIIVLAPGIFCSIPSMPAQYFCSFSEPWIAVPKADITQMWRACMRGLMNCKLFIQRRKRDLIVTNRVERKQTLLEADQERNYCVCMWIPGPRILALI